MAAASSSSVILSRLSTATVLDKREYLGSSIGLRKSSFFPDPKLVFASPRKPKTNSVRRCCYRAPVAKSLDHIPKQFREENLKDGCEPLFLLSFVWLRLALTRDRLWFSIYSLVSVYTVIAQFSFLAIVFCWAFRSLKFGFFHTFACCRIHLISESEKNFKYSQFYFLLFLTSLVGTK